MFFPKEDSWMDPDINIRRLEGIETDLIQHMELMQDSKLIIKFQRELNNILRVKMKWIEMKNKLELIGNV